LFQFEDLLIQYFIKLMDIVELLQFELVEDMQVVDI